MTGFFKPAACSRNNIKAAYRHRTTVETRQLILNEDIFAGFFLQLLRQMRARQRRSLGASCFRRLDLGVAASVGRISASQSRGRSGPQKELILRTRSFADSPVDAPFARNRMKDSRALERDSARGDGFKGSGGVAGGAGIEVADPNNQGPPADNRTITGRRGGGPR